ncbi:MAG TPA: hypothetical protein VMF90_07445, partial [Rhizobiaceae bacterium]|nr:hypothetical protein [Rhizobiaceae bacterium]
MDQTVDRHEKIKFGRGDITGLDTFPSSAGHDHIFQDAKRRKSLLRWAGIATGAFSALVVLLVAGIYFVGVYGISTERVHDRAEQALRDLAGLDVEAELGPARLTFGGSGLLSVAVDDIRLIDRATGAPVVEAGSLEFGVKVLPLISGDIEFGSAHLSGARIQVAMMPERGDADWAAALKNADGLIDPDKVSAAAFAGIHDAFTALTQGEARSVELEDVEIVLPGDALVGRISIANAQLDVSDDEHISITATADIDGRAATLEGTAERDAVSNRITRLDLKATAAAPAVADQQASEVLRTDRIGEVLIAVTGEEGIGDTPSRLAANLKLGQSTVWIDEKDNVSGTLDMLVSTTTGQAKAEIERLLFIDGNSSFDFNGAIGPRSGQSAQAAPHYRIELVSDRSISSPSDSTEPALEFVARIAGRFDPASTILSLPEIGIRTDGGGELLASAAIDFEPGKRPGITLSAQVPQMPVQYVKQLWPYIAAPGARRWAMNRLFGGTVTNSSLQYQVVPGRLGNGIPLSRDEVFGRFEISGARFDVTGDIPPVRDAVGVVEFHGNDVDVALSSGTAWMPSGRFVTAGSGTLKIRNANKKEVIGDLDMNVSGKADAIAELASVEPINGMRYVGLSADDFSGEASGNVKARVPIFGNDQHPNELGWLVSLGYQNLSLAKPIDGQMFTDGNGTIVVDPHKAVISAKAKLNGAPAEIDMVEPFGDDKSAKEQNVELVLDDKARSALVPGLEGLISGPVRVRLDMSNRERQAISADLTDAKLMIPWAGWTKGAGVSGEISFVMETDGDTARLSDLKLRGKSFSVDGDVTLDNGSLRSGRFSSVKLNRDDNASLTIDRSGRTMKVSIKGKSLDVRSIVNQLTEDAEGTAEAAGGGAVSVEADVASLTGFNGERLSGVSLSYRGSGARIDSL